MQFDLFPPPPLDTSADAALAAKRPPGLFLGTSSWTFPGWGGIVYRGKPTQDTLIKYGLEEYARHPLFNTVAIDRSFYAPLSPDELKRYAAQLPAGFRCVMKVWNAVTRPGPQFLDPAFFNDAVLAPVDAAFRDHIGPLLFQFTPLSPSELPRPNDFAFKLDRFFSRLPKTFQYAVELRNAELMTPSYFQALTRNDVAHVFNHWERMPSVAEQLAHQGSLTGPHVVCRLLIPQGVGYEEAREAFAPFDKLQAIDLEMRAQARALWIACKTAGRSLSIIVNNKAEGSSPLTVRGLLETIVESE
ncbi:MAG: DUF72 domain-containing protein [Archangium sp.]|nr:DUF72 domain-containing protein [Archangium sp.]